MTPTEQLKDVGNSLRTIRSLVETLWPEDCCPKADAVDNEDRVTTGCVQTCLWNQLELEIATAMAVAGIDP